MRKFSILFAMALGFALTGCAEDDAASDATNDQEETTAGEEETTAGEEETAGGDEVEAKCPGTDLSGYYDLQFKVSMKDTPSVVWMDVAKTEDDKCYGGKVIAPSTGDELASVDSIVQKDDNLEITFVDFLIPAGQTPLPPDGGVAEVILTATDWGKNPTMCGDIVYKLKEPFRTEDTGTFAAAVQDSGFYLPKDMGYRCDMIAEGEETAGGEETEFVVTSTDESEGYLNFTPKDLTVPVGATVKFVMSNTHNAIEVSQETFENRQSTPLDGGFQVKFGETKEVTFYEVGVHYYVCTPHVSMDMVGTITVYNE